MARRKRDQTTKASSAQEQESAKTIDPPSDAGAIAAAFVGLAVAEPTSEPASESDAQAKPEKDDAQQSERIALPGRMAKTFEGVESLLGETADADAAMSPRLSQWQEAVEDSLDKKFKEASQQMRAQFHSLTRSLEICIEDQFAKAGKQTDFLLPTSADSRVEESDLDPSADSASDGNYWEQRKRKMFADSGEDYVSDTPFKTPADHDAKAAAEKAEQDELASLTESLHDSIESLDEVEAEDIEDLRDQLSGKLREAEVELSINRAKLDQRRANLDQRESELERREKSLASKYADVEGKPQKKGVLDRLTRHLGARKERDSL